MDESAARFIRTLVPMVTKRRDLAAFLAHGQEHRRRRTNIDAFRNRVSAAGQRAGKADARSWIDPRPDPVVMPPDPRLPRRNACAEALCFGGLPPARANPAALP